MKKIVSVIMKKESKSSNENFCKTTEKVSQRSSKYEACSLRRKITAWKDKSLVKWFLSAVYYIQTYGYKGRERKKTSLVLAVEKLIIHENVAVLTSSEKDRKNNCIHIYCLWAAAPITLLCREVGWENTHACPHTHKPV